MKGAEEGRVGNGFDKDCLKETLVSGKRNMKVYSPYSVSVSVSVSLFQFSCPIPRSDTL